jgi:hypothetical protein
VNAGEFTAAKGMKGVRRDERDGGGEKREKETPEKGSCVLFYVL